MPPLPLRTLALGLAGVLLLASAGLEVRRRAKTTRERARFGLLKDDAEMFADALATSLRLPEACLPIFANVKPEPGRKLPVTLNYRHDPSLPDALAAGHEAWVGTQVKSLDLTMAEYPDRRTRIGGKELRHFRARLDTEFIVGDRFAGGVPMSLEILFWLNGAGEIVACYGARSVGALCDLANGYYDVDAKPERRCRPSSHARIVTMDGDLPRGTCRVTKIVSDGAACLGGAKQAILTQEKVGFGTSRRVLCQSCEP